MAKKRVLVIADLHSGNTVGLTPTGFNSFRERDKAYQKKCWDIYLRELRKIKPIDILIVNGDCTDGKQSRRGSRDLITADPAEQIKMASICIKKVGAKKIHMTYGTPYHTGTEMDYEDQIAAAVGAEIHDHLFLDVNGHIFDCKHAVGSSTIPHGRFTPTAKEHLWNVLWKDQGETPQSDIIIRSHVHYFSFCGEHTWLAMTTPALQGLGSQFGARRCSGTVHFGMVLFDVYKKTSFTPKIEWRPIIIPTVNAAEMITTC